MNLNIDATESPLSVLARLRDELGPLAVLIGADVPERNCKDWSTQPPQTPSPWCARATQPACQRP